MGDPRPTAGAIGILVDTDGGVDDAFALALARTSPEVTLSAVSTVFGNVPVSQATINSLRVVDTFGRSRVPVAQGAGAPWKPGRPTRGGQYAHGPDGLGGSGDLFHLSHRPQPCSALHLLERTVTSARPGRSTMVALGPLTNIAEGISTQPAIVRGIDRLVVMGGSLGEGNITPYAEFNFWNDPDAAHFVLTQDNLPVVVVPLDLTNRAWVTGDWLTKLARSGADAGVLVAASSQYHAFYSDVLGHDGMVLHDVVAMATVIWPELFRYEERHLTVDCGKTQRGAVRVGDPAVGAGQPVSIAVNVDIPELYSRVLDRLSRRA